MDIDTDCTCCALAWLVDIKYDVALPCLFHIARCLLYIGARSAMKVVQIPLELMQNLFSLL